MPAFHEVQLPTDIAEGAVGGPRHSTVVVTVDNGAEQRIGELSTALIRYEISLQDRTPTQLRELIAFFRARKGRLYGFRFRDWSDYQLDDEPMVNPYPLLDAQIIKTYADVAGSEVRNITKPIDGTLTVKKNGVTLTEGAQYTVDYTTGIITFSALAALDTLTVSGEFDVPVRFDVDEMRFTLEATTVTAWENVPLVETLI